MKRLDIWHNKRLKNIDVSDMKDLEYLNVAWTNMTKIDVTTRPTQVSKSNKITANVK